MGMGGQRHPQVAFHPGKNPGNKLGRKAGGPHIHSRRMWRRNFLTPAGVKPRTVQPLTSGFGQPKHKWEVPLPATSFTTKPTESDMDIRPGHLGEKPYKNHLGYGKAFLCG
jgi:hypothetical protein